MNYRESVVMPTRKKAPQRNPLLHVIFFRKIAFHRKAAPFCANRFRCLEVAAARLPWRARGGNSRHRSARSSRIRGEEYAGFDPPASALISVSSFAWPYMSLEVQTEAMLPR